MRTRWGGLPAPEPEPAFVADAAERADAQRRMRSILAAVSALSRSDRDVLAPCVWAETTAWRSDGSEVSGVLVRLRYGDVSVGLARDLAGRYAVGFGDAESPTPPEGSIAVTGRRSAGWHGELRHGDFSVAISARRKEDVLTAARALRPHG